eukprot:5364067-Amphidinium_carterae.1
MLAMGYANLGNVAVTAMKNKSRRFMSVMGNGNSKLINLQNLKSVRQLDGLQRAECQTSEREPAKPSWVATCSKPIRPLWVTPSPGGASRRMHVPRHVISNSGGASSVVSLEY